MQLHKPGITLHIPDKDELFNQILTVHDFSKAKNSLQSVRIMFNAMFPTLQTIIEDNETLLYEQSKTLKNYADLDEKYKNLKVDYDNLREQFQKQINGKVETI